MPRLRDLFALNTCRRPQFRVRLPATVPSVRRVVPGAASPDRRQACRDRFYFNLSIAALRLQLRQNGAELLSAGKYDFGTSLARPVLLAGNASIRPDPHLLPTGRQRSDDFDRLVPRRMVDDQPPGVQAQCRG